MNLKLLTPKQSLNKAYLKEKISRTAIELFKVQFIDLISKINEKGDEEHLKSLVADFLKLTYYNASQNQINPIGKNDLVIHTGKSPADPYGVILEVKSPANKAEMINGEKANVKAVHELVLYYLDERVVRNRNELKQLIVTNIYDWYIIDANEFDKKVYRNTAIKKLYELKKTDNKDNPWFYDELKKLLAASTDFSIDATFFDLRGYKKITGNAEKQDDKGLIALYKILSPVHLLKLPFANDSNTLQPKFYSELLHLVGLYEYKEGSKKLISRKKEGERNRGSLLENAIEQLDSHDKISRLDKPSQYGDNYGDRIYAVALELVITWVNRILFLKLLEAQLINYHKGDQDYTFLDKEKIKDFGDLDKLFFRVLAKRFNERNDDVQKLFSKVPYLNSSLFEPTELEHQTLFIHGLEDFVPLPVISSTVLKDTHGKTLKGNLNTLDYLFAFLNAYDFSSEGAEEIQEDNKQLINASVLGLIFEKINGYKDGSFFTPGFITMYMCRETIRRAVVQKFNEAKGWDCQEYSELYDRITDKKEANTLINSLKICDPAVGSGHFLVSALNEIIAIKSDLRVLTGRDGRGMHHYGIEVVNDELIITDEDGDIFEYNPNSKESQRVQEALFHEKQTIIENCLFGVDINPNSVKICRLRLWIELLKNAYYKVPEDVSLSSSEGSISKDSPSKRDVILSSSKERTDAGPHMVRVPHHDNARELETLPNIDINIKTGNSLISRFALDADLKQALRGSKWNINDYRIAVATYKNATDKNAKRELVGLIDTIKQNFSSSISRNGKEYKELSKLRGQLDKLLNSNEDLFGIKKNKNELELEQRRLEISIADQEAAIEAIKSNKIYTNAFEWRFEFPEVLSDDGDFMGFDVVIGNPPYGVIVNAAALEILNINLRNGHSKILNDSYFGFIALGSILNNTKGYLSYIIPNTWRLILTAKYFRNEMLSRRGLFKIDTFLTPVFVDAVVDCDIFFAQNNSIAKNIVLNINSSSIVIKNTLIESKTLLKQNSINPFLTEKEYQLLNKLNIGSKCLNQIVLIKNGVKPYEKGKGNPKQSKEVLELKPFTSKTKVNATFMPLIGGADFHKYLIKWNFDNYISYGEWLAAPRDKGIFKAPQKIIIRQTSDKLVAAIISAGFIMRNNTHILLPNDPNYDLKYILALLNSKLFDFIYWVINPEKGEALAEVKAIHLDNLPIKIIRIEVQEPLIKIVNKIIELKIKGEETVDLEKRVDFLVYQLYGLTEEEIKIVEDAV